MHGVIVEGNYDDPGTVLPSASDEDGKGNHAKHEAE